MSSQTTAARFRRPYSDSCFERGKPADVKLSSSRTELYSNKYYYNSPLNIYYSKCPCILTPRECPGYVVSNSASCDRQSASQSHRPSVLFENLNEFHIPSRKISEYHISYDRLICRCSLSIGTDKTATDIGNQFQYKRLIW